MTKSLSPWMAAAAVLSASAVASAGTEPYFEPLTGSAAVVLPNDPVEINEPWVTPAGVTQRNLTSMQEIEADLAQSVVRVPGTGRRQSMWDMLSYDPTGRFMFIPHETPFGAGVSRYDTQADRAETLFQGDSSGATGDWDGDWGAFDPSTFTPMCSVLLGEEWTAEGRLLEVTNPFADVADIQVRELDSIPNVAHEGLRFSADARTLYFVDEWNSGALYKFVMKGRGKRDLSQPGQTFVLSVDAYDGDPADFWDEPSNLGQPRTGPATWIPITDEDGNPLTTVDPYRNGPTNDPRDNDDTRGGRPAADEVGATPYGRLEDMEVGRLRSGNEVVYFTATSEQSVYSVEILSDSEAMVRLFASEAATPKNVGFAPTTGVLNSPDNLAQDALGNIYVIEDAPNGSSTGGDIWFARDANSDGVAESLDHFLSIQVAESEATGMIFHPVKATKFVTAVQHPQSVDLDVVPGGFGDAAWEFDVKNVDTCPSGASFYQCLRNRITVLRLKLAGLRANGRHRNVCRRTPHRG